LKNQPFARDSHFQLEMPNAEIPYENNNNIINGGTGDKKAHIFIEL